MCRHQASSRELGFKVCQLQVPLGVALAELSPAGVRALVAAAALLSAPEGLGASVLLRRGMLAGALALLAPVHLHAVVRFSLGETHCALRYMLTIWQTCQQPLWCPCPGVSHAESPLACEAACRSCQAYFFAWMQAAWAGPAGGDAGVAGLAAAVVDLLIGPLRPAAALPEGHLLQYQVQQHAMTGPVSAHPGLTQVVPGGRGYQLFAHMSGPARNGLLLCADDVHCCHRSADLM